MHFAYWPPQLNVKALPEWFKAETRQKFEEELYPYLKENWQRCTGVREAGIDYETWEQAEYGLKRIEGLLTFMESEDWSVRLPEMAEWCYTVSKTRFLDFNEIFPDYDWLEWYK